MVVRLLKVEPIGPQGELISSADPTRYIYRTGRVVKGKSRLARGRRLVVISARESASCGLMNEVGRLTGLFLYREDGAWTSGSCGEISAGQMRRVKVTRASAACS